MSIGRKRAAPALMPSSCSERCSPSELGERRCSPEASPTKPNRPSSNAAVPAAVRRASRPPCRQVAGATGVRGATRNPQRLGFYLAALGYNQADIQSQIFPLQLRANLRQIALLLLLTAAAIFVHGYHPFVEDAEIYLPGVKKALNPALYPANTAFFLSHAKMTIFPHLIAGSVRVTHIRLSVALLLWQFAAIFFLLWACWRIGQLVFRDSLAAWGGAALVASLLTIPVAGTALYIMDQYLTTRALSTPATLWVIVSAIERKWVRAGLWLVFTGLIHPLMVVF